MTENETVDGQEEQANASGPNTTPQQIVTAPVVTQQAETWTPRVFLAKNADPHTVEGPIHIGMEDPIVVPSEEEQRAGFKVDNWTALVAQFPDVYKVEKPLRRGEQQQAEEPKGFVGQSQTESEGTQEDV